MSNKNEVFEYLIGQLRQQVNNNRCEDLAHEVQSLKNQLRDASAQIKELHKALATATGDAEAYKLIRKGGYINGGQLYVVGEHGPGAAINCRCTSTPVQPEQSGCRKEDTQDSEPWIECDGACPVLGDTVVAIKFRNGEVESGTKASGWSWGVSGSLYDIVAYRVVKQQRRKEDTQECTHDFIYHGSETAYKCIKCGAKLK